MPTAYIGYRNVLKGRSEAINTYTGKKGVYSNWELMNPSHVLDGFPDHNRVPGSGPYGEGDYQEVSCAILLPAIDRSTRSVHRGWVPVDRQIRPDALAHGCVMPFYGTP